MSKLDDLAERYLVREKVDRSDFQKRARILQSIWRQGKGFEIGEYRGKKRGNILPMPWAKDTLNNYLSDNIKKVVENEVISNQDNGKLFSKPRIFNNLLSSQPLCFNLFAELKNDLQLASKVFSALAPDRIKEVTKIEFEHSPGRRDMKYTGDRSAFDVYIEYDNLSGGKCFAGIEVKYHENLLNKPAKMRCRYFQIASKMNCFKEDCVEKLQESPLEQIWRDHLLACSIILAKDFDDGFFMFLYSKDNIHCSQAVRDYKKCIKNTKSFQIWTIEDVARIIKNNTQNKWVDNFIDRYLNFEKIDCLIK